MNQSDIAILLRKADELRSLFVLGQRVIPFLEELFLFVRDIEPMLKEINSSIEDNLKKMPSASKQLSKVTEATELATTEIMDIVDALNFKTEVISENLDRIKTSKIDDNKTLRILEIINRAVSKDIDTSEVLPELGKLIESLKGSNKNTIANDIDNTIDETKNLIDEIKQDSSSIMMSLQVQDITSQQLAAVNHMIGTVQSKLQGILKYFENARMDELVEKKDNIDNVNISMLHRNIAFDPEAVDSMDFVDKEKRQKAVDDVINSKKDFLQNSKENNEEKSKINFSLSIASMNKLEEPETKEDRTSNDDSLSQIEETDHLESYSQDDIDALFGK